MAQVGKKAKARKQKKEPPCELESQFILRLPPEQAASVRSMIRAGGAASRDGLKIDLSPDGRHAVVEVDAVPLAAKLVDLPCVISSLKTLDGKTFYKTADVSQMLVCSADGDHRHCREEVGAAAAAGGHGGELERRYVWKHGITPPLKNVRKKRFRKTTKKHPNAKQAEKSCSESIESKDVEKEVKRLLRSDAEAISIRWEVVADDAKAVQSRRGVPHLPVSPEMGGPVSSKYDTPQQAFRDPSSRHEDKEDEEEQKDESDEDVDGEKEDDSEEDLERELQAKFIECSLYEADEGYNSVIMRIQNLIHCKEKKLQEIKEKAQRQKDLLRKLENVTLKSHFQSVLEQLKLKEKQKYEQITFLQQQLKYFLKK